MATKEELLDGLRFVPAQAKRVAGILDRQGDWDSKRSQGWTPKEMFTHVAVTAGMIPAMGPGMIAAPEATELTAGLDIASMNAAAVGSLAEMDTSQIVETLQGNYSKLTDWVKGLSDDQLQGKHTFLSMNLTAADLLMTLTVLHSTHHIYEAQLPVAI